MTTLLEEILKRVLDGQYTESDLLAIAHAIQAGQIVLTCGEGAIGINGDIINSSIISGHNNVFGNNNIIIQGESANTIQTLLKFSPKLPTAPSIAIEDLVQQVRSRIHDDIQRLHGTMPLWGVDHWVPLGELFVDVNILEEVSSNRRSELADLWQDFSQNPGYRSLDRIGLGREHQRVSGLEVLEKHTNLMVVGKPGSGKTTYLQRVVTECNAGNLQAHRIPVLIRLREFVEDGRGVAYAVERYLERCWQLSAGEVQSVLDAGRSLVLLDGLDEVMGETGKAIVKQIKRFARDYPQVQVIVTCRTQSQESRFERFDYVEVADFNEPQVRAFTEHWFQTVCGDVTVGQAKVATFLKQLFREENKPIRELAITPILLSLTCAVFQQTGKFYSKRSKLYEEGLELLLEQWDRSREIERDAIYRDLSVERRLELLSYLAVKKFEQEQYVLFEQTEIEGYIAEFLGIGLRESRGVLRAIESQHGLLIERSQRIWSFSHLTFQEYLVACEIVCTRDSNIDSSSKLKALANNHITEKHWREVFLLISEIPECSEPLIREMYDRILDLGINSKKIELLIGLSHQRYPNIETLLKSPEFQEESIEEAIYWLPVVRAICFEIFIELVHDIYLLLSIFNNNNKKVDVEFALQLKSSRDFHKNYELAVSMEDIVSQSPKNALDQFARIPLASQVDEILQPIKEPMFYIDFSKNSLTKLNQLASWWDLNGEAWNAKLEDFVTKSKVVLQELEFNQEELSCIKEYYDANKLLVDCIKNGSTIGETLVRQIRESLLLPIAEIEKRNREKSE